MGAVILRYQAGEGASWGPGEDEEGGEGKEEKRVEVRRWESSVVPPRNAGRTRLAPAGRCGRRGALLTAARRGRGQRPPLKTVFSPKTGAPSASTLAAGPPASANQACASSHACFLVTSPRIKAFKEVRGAGVEAYC